MRRFLSLGLVALVIVLAGIALVALTPAEAAPQQASPAQSGEVSPCQPVYNKIADPNVVLYGEEVDITLTVKALCAGERFPLHIVLVLDGSGSMQGQPTQQMKQAAARMIRGLDMGSYPSTKVGVVEFNSQARRLCSLTNNENQAVGAVNRVGANGGTRIDLGIMEGLRVISQGRSGLNRDELTEVMVVLSDGGNNAGCAPVLAAARQARGQGILLIAVCVGNSCDEQCMRQVASGPRYYFRAQNAGQLSAVFERIRDRILKINLRKLTVYDALPDWMEYVPGSADPPQSSPDDPDQWLKWEDVYVPADGVTYAFKVKPLKTGYMPTNAEATGNLIDNKGRSREWVFQVPWVTVLQPEPLSTAATPPPTPTFTPVPTDTPTPTPTITPSPTNTPTPRPKPIYLPILLKERCEVTNFYADIALVLDMSTSMNWPTSAGRPKLDAVLQGAMAFIQPLDFTPDENGRNYQVAVVGFNSSAWIQHPLDNDKGDIEKAINDLRKRQGEGTRLDLAFYRGNEALDPELRIPGNMPVMIMLTDGLPNKVPYDPEDGLMETTVLKAAAAAKAVGIRVYTIGVGKDDPTAPLLEQINAELLRECASHPTMFFHEPDAEDVEEIYRQISTQLNPCDGRHDWSVPWPPTPVIPY
jgi:Mg-chelatase subunit ChlD